MMTEKFFYALIEFNELACSSENYCMLSQAQRDALEVVAALIEEHADKFFL